MKKGEELKKRLLSKKIDWDKDNKNWKNVKKALNKYLLIGLVVGFIIGAMSIGIGKAQEKESYEKQLLNYEDQISDYKNEISDYIYEINNKEDEINKLNEKVEEAAPWFEMKEEERKAEEEKLAKEKAAKEKAEKEAQEKKEAEEKAAAEKKEKQGYNTGITYKQLARTPDDYLFEKVKFEGKVIQVMEDDDRVQIRLAVGGDYDNILLGEYDSEIVNSRVLEDDYITIYGISSGLITYESTLGASITIPGVLIDKIDM